MGVRDPVRRSTLADANEARDWRIYAELARRLIGQARRLYTNEDLSFDLANTVYALDSTTIDLCLAVFPWAHFRTTKAAVKMHTLLDLRGNIPSFIHVSDGKLHDVHALDPRFREGRLCCSRKRAPSMSWIAATSISPGSMCCTWPEPSSSPVPNRTWMLIGSIPPRQTARPASFAIRPSPPASAGASSGRPLHHPALPRTPAAHPLPGRRNGKEAGVPHQSVRVAGYHHRRALQKPLASRTVLQMDQAALADQTLLRHIRKCREDPNLDRRLGLRPRRHRQEAASPGRLALQIATDPLGHPVRENADASSTCPRRFQMRYCANN